MRIGKMALGIAAAAVVGVAAIGLVVLVRAHDDSSSLRTPTTVFCSVLMETNGSQLVEKVRARQMGGKDSVKWIADGFADMALPGIRHDMTTVRDGVESRPTNPSRETLAAAARVDAFVLKTCGSQMHG